MREKVLPCFLGLALGAATFAAETFTTESVPADGVYKFTFGVSETQDGSIPVSADAVCDVKDETLESGKFSYGFLGTTDTSYIDDIPWSLGEPRAIDGFSVVSGQKIVLRNAADANGVSCVAGPAKSEYLPAGASDYEGRYPIRFAMRGEEYAYYAVTCTVANASSTATADVTLFSERTHIIAHHLSLAPGETKTFAWSVELAPNVYKTQGTYRDDCVNVCVVGENAALVSLTVAKRPQTAGTVRGEAVDNMNVGRTMWLCTDSTGTDQAIATPFFSLQNYAGVGSGLSRWAPANLSIRNQGEGGLATNANAHRQSCRLKPGDYLYVEYGHNESGVTSFTNNLETYLSDANAAGAYLVIVSPVERRTGWDSGTSTWGRSLQGIAEAGEAWVEDKIAQGARNVAFIDLNKKYNAWMNTELQRIHEVNSEVSLNAAISFYYRSAKGANVDNTHINTAGADRAAYCVWQDALERVAAGENAEEGSAAKVQADVLKGITDGCQLKVGVGGTVDNTPWLVSDEIINAGAAPNSFWDTPVSEGYAYVNDAAVANVEATANADGTVTITGVTMRILNPNNYYKSVIEVFSASGLSQGVYYSYYNYDIGGAGKVSGDLVNPNQPGFLTSDRGKDDVSAADVESITVPAGGKALVWIAEADAGTWQVGENAPCSAKYPVEWWSDVLLEDDCSSLGTWRVNTGAVHSESVVDGAIYFTTSGADSGNTKKNYGLNATQFASAMSTGRYRITFKAKMDSGTLNFELGDSLYSTTTSLFNNKVTLLSIAGTTATGYKSTAPEITIGEDGEGNPINQSVVNKLRWVDVDIIIDRDNDRALVSVGGSDYVEYENTAFLPGSDVGRTWNYFGITCPGQQSSYGYIDDVKIVKLASVEYPTITATAAPSDAAMGSVTINGYETDALSIYSGNDFMIRATSADPDFYAFQNWTDGEGNVVSTDANLFIENASEDISRTANFREYARSENRVETWDFSAYQGDFEVAPSDAITITDNGMTISLQSGDKITADGIYWHNSALGHKTGTETLSADGDHYIVYTPSSSGTLTLKFSVDAFVDKRQPRMTIKAADAASECSNYDGLVSVMVSAADTEYTLSAELAAETTYYIWTYSYNWGGAGFQHNYTIPSITYTYAPTYYTTTAAVAEGQEKLGTVLVSAAEVISGKSVTFTAKPVSDAYKFENWTDGEDNVVSTDATYTTAVTADLALTAHFALDESENYVAAMNFERFAGDNAVAFSSVQTVNNGCFDIQMVSGDSISDAGIVWYKVAVDDKNSLGTELSEASDHYIKFTAPYDGTVSFTASVNSLHSKYTAHLYIKAADAASECKTSGDAGVDFTEADKDYTLSLNVTEGTTYYVWAYSWNAGAGGYNPYITISSLTYTHASDHVTLTLAAGENGSVAINGVSGAGSYTVQKGEYVHLTATPSAYYGLGSWTDGESTVLSTEEEYWHYVAAAGSVTANFVSESLIDITRSADFTPFAGDDAIAGEEAAWSQLVGRMEIHGAVGDTLTDEGIYWAGPGTTTSDTTRNTSGRYIKFNCTRSGTVSLSFKGGLYDTSKPNNSCRIYVTDGTSNYMDCMYKDNTHVTNVTISAANKDTMVSFAASEGNIYYIWPFCYKQPAAQFYITSISYAAAKSDYYTVRVNGEDQKVYHGDAIVLDAPETTSTGIFTGWVDGNSESLGSGTHLLLTVTAVGSATATYRDADAHNFVWNSAVAEGDWNDSSNWLYEGLIPASTYPGDASQDVVVFNTAATVNLPAAAVASNVWFNANATLSGNTLAASIVGGEGAITLSNAGFAGVSSSDTTISNEVVMVAETVNSFNVSSAGNMYIRGNISGAGRFNVVFPNTTGCDCLFYGNNNDFQGDVYTSGGKSNRNRLYFANENAAGTNSFWHVGHSYDTYSGDSTSTMGGSVKFGGVDGPWWDRYDGCLLTIGYLNRDSTINISNSVDGRANSVKKVGTAKLTLGTTRIKNLTIEGGSVAMPIGIAPQTLTLAAGTTIYLAGDAAWTAGTVTNLFSYTTLTGVDAKGLAQQVSVKGLDPRRVAKVSVADGVVTATIKNRFGFSLFLR